MSSLINKNKKRKCIALSCKKILLEERINKLTIAQLAKEANIGKGTIYEYFENKEDIVLELNTLLYENYRENIYEKIEKEKDYREKIKLFLTLIYEDKFNCHRKIFKKFIGITYSSENNSIIEFQRNWYKENFEYLKVLIKESSENKRLINNDINVDELVDSIINTMLGFFLLSFFTKSISETRNDIKKYINSIYKK